MNNTRILACATCCFVLAWLTALTASWWWAAMLCFLLSAGTLGLLVYEVRKQC